MPLRSWRKDEQILTSCRRQTIILQGTFNQDYRMYPLPNTNWLGCLFDLSARNQQILTHAKDRRLARYPKDVFPIEGNMIHDPVTHTITTPAMFSPSPMPCRRPLTWPLNKWMYSFQSRQDQDQQQILSRPTSLLVIDTVQYSTAKSLLDGELPFQCLSLWAWMAQVTS
jgi:hypothetical protein